MNATELTNFFLTHRGRCFGGWTVEKIFNYVLVNLVHGNVFVAAAAGLSTQPRSETIGLAAIAWLDDAATIMAKAERGLPQFDWKGFPSSGDSILIADVAGDRRLMPEILNQVIARWFVGKWRCHPPAIFQKRVFTYRRGKLVELSWPTVFRFAGYPKARRATGNSPGFQAGVNVELNSAADCEAARSANLMCGPSNPRSATRARNMPLLRS